MSENLENVDVVNEAEIVEPVSEKSADSECEDVSVDNINKTEDEKNNLSEFTEFLKDLADKKMQYDKEIDEKREYLSSNLVKYDNEDYFGNDNFKELYSEAFKALGVGLDTEKFVNLLDKYVESRINSHSKKESAKKENEKLTDSFAFDSGNLVKSEAIPKMQDIPAEELEKYIAKYI